jgi:predicted MFS family arabinose efflux permease
MVALVYGLVRAPTAGWGDGVTVAFLASGTAILGLFITMEARSTHPLLPLRLLADRDRAATYAVMLCNAGAIFGVFFFLTQILQNAYGYSPLRAGVAFLPFSLGIAATSETVAQLLGKAGPRVFATAGPLLSAVGLAWLSRIGPHTGYVEGILGPLLVLAVGLGFTFVPLTLGATAGVAPAELGIASALLNSAQQVGGTLGLAVLVTVATTLTRTAYKAAAGSVARQSARSVAIRSSIHGYRGAFLVGSGIAFVGFLLSVTALRIAPPRARLRGDPGTGVGEPLRRGRATEH